jgi:hypothetical protein
MNDGGYSRWNDCIIGELIEAPKNFGNIRVVGGHHAASAD